MEYSCGVPVSDLQTVTAKQEISEAVTTQIRVYNIQ